MKRAFMLFSIALNLLLVLSVVLLLQKEKAEDRRAVEEREAMLAAAKAEGILLLERAERLYEKGDIVSACRSLGIAQYALFGVIDEEICSAIGAAEAYFDERAQGEEQDDDLFFAFVDEMKKIIKGEIKIAQSETVFEISSFLAEDTIDDNGQGVLWGSTAVGESAARKTAAETLGRNLLLSLCENSIFPMRYIFAGGNTYASVTAMGGKLGEALFYPGGENLRISEQKAVRLMRDFLDAKGYNDLSLGFHFSLGGVYYARFFLPQNKDAYVTIGVRGRSGSICLLEANHMLAYVRANK